MNKILSSMMAWFGGGALSDHHGQQVTGASGSLIEDTSPLSSDRALQLSTVWGCVWLLTNIVASLPLFAYTRKDGQRDLARDTLIWQLLHDSPNSRMTPLEFWRAMILNFLLRGNAYARIDRNSAGDAIAMWPMSADQVEMRILPDGTSVYAYRLGSDVALFSEINVLHMRDLGNGSIGLARMDYMRATTSEASNAQSAANKLFANGGKPSGILMIDKVLNKDQRAAIKANFSEMAEGGTSRLHVLEADMKYEQVNLSPQDQQLLETRKFTVEEICRWFLVPPVLLGHANGGGSYNANDQIIDTFYKLVVRPLLVGIEQSITKRVLSPAQRARFTVEFNFDALLRSNIKDRMEVYAKGAQNGIVTRNECRQLENLPPIEGGDELTAQSNLVPLHLLGTVVTQGASNANTQTPTAQ